MVGCVLSGRKHIENQTWLFADQRHRSNKSNSHIHHEQWLTLSLLGKYTPVTPVFPASTKQAHPFPVTPDHLTKTCHAVRTGTGLFEQLKSEERPTFHCIRGPLGSRLLGDWIPSIIYPVVYGTGRQIKLLQSTRMIQLDCRILTSETWKLDCLLKIWVVFYFRVYRDHAPLSAHPVRNILHYAFEFEIKY